MQWRSDKAKVVATGVNAPFAGFSYNVAVNGAGQHVGTVIYTAANLNQADRATLTALAQSRAQLTVKVSFNDQRFGDMILNLRP